MDQLATAITALLAWRPGTTQLWILGCIAAWLLIVWLITLIISRPTPEDDRQQARDVSRPAPLEPRPPCEVVPEIQRRERVRAAP